VDAREHETWSMDERRAATATKHRNTNANGLRMRLALAYHAAGIYSAIGAAATATFELIAVAHET
jgi:hypothetical protein